MTVSKIKDDIKKSIPLDLDIVVQATLKLLELYKDENQKFLARLQNYEHNHTVLLKNIISYIELERGYNKQTQQMDFNFTQQFLLEGELPTDCYYRIYGEYLILYNVLYDIWTHKNDILESGKI